MNTRILRRGLVGLGLLVAGAIVAPAAFARTHVSIGLGFYGPGYSIGINDCLNCYRYPAYSYPAYSYPTYYYPAYYPAYPAYYAPAPRYYYGPAYYRPAPVRYYNRYPVYGTVYYNSREGYHDRDYDHGHDYDHGSSGYNSSNYRSSNYNQSNYNQGSYYHH